MTSFEDLRVELRDALEEADLHAFLIEPEKVNPPLVFVSPDDPYLTFEGANSGNVIVHHQLAIAAGRGVNEVAAGEVDRILAVVLNAIPADYAIGDARTGKITINGQQYLGAEVNVLREIALPTPSEVSP